MSKRKDILQAIKTKLQMLTTIAPSANVFYWHDFPLEWEQNAIEFRIGREENKQVNIPLENELVVQVQAINFTVEEFIEEDITDTLKRAFVDENWGGLSLSTNIIRNYPVIRTSGKRSVSVFMEIKIKYRENLE